MVLSLWLILTEEVATAPAELSLPWRVDIRHASRSELMVLPGVGPTMAGRILEFRATHTIDHAEKLSQIHGIGPVTVEDVRRLIVFEDMPQ